MFAEIVERHGFVKTRDSLRKLNNRKGDILKIFTFFHAKKMPELTVQIVEKSQHENTAKSSLSNFL